MQRTQSYVANQQVLAAELNGIQDMAIGSQPADVNNTHTLMANGQDVIMWMYDVADVANATEVKVDAARDYRDRILMVFYTGASGANQWPGSALDRVFDYTVPVRMGYTGLGALGAASAAVVNGVPPVPADGTSWALQIASNVWLYTHVGDGALYLYNNSGGVIRTPILTIFASADTGKR